MAQGRNRVKSYKIHKIEAVPEEDWIVVQNTHEPLVNREIFEKVKQL
ncbi:recombinase family protein [Anaeromonas gelatinilytica]|nr:recombinase family protein [Anaeromonas gelatinilytica]